MRLLFCIVFLTCGIIYSYASIEERILDLENVVQDQFVENEKMKDRLKELEHEVAALIAMEEEESANNMDDYHLIDKRDAQSHALPVLLLTRAASSSKAFHAYLSSGTHCYTNNQEIVFDVEVQDDFNLYDVRDGLFEATETGVYVFTWTVAVPTNTRITTELVVGGQMRGVITTDSDKQQNNDGAGSGLHPATGVVVASLYAGDRCYIRARHSLHNCVNVLSNSNSVRSTFSGWKLY